MANGKTVNTTRTAQLTAEQHGYSYMIRKSNYCPYTRQPFPNDEASFWASYQVQQESKITTEKKIDATRTWAKREREGGGGRESERKSQLEQFFNSQGRNELLADNYEIIDISSSQDSGRYKNMLNEGSKTLCSEWIFANAHDIKRPN